MSDSEHSHSQAEPEKARDPQVERLADSARELARSIKAANGLPPRFPEEEMLALADALQDAPPADFEAVLEATLYTRERFVATREQFVLEAPDDPDLPGIEAVANRLNDTIAELSTVVAKAGREAASAALPKRDPDKDMTVAADAVEADVTAVQRHVDAALAQTEIVQEALKSNAQQINIDQSRHYHISLFTVSIDNLKFKIKIVGASLKSRPIDGAWLEKLLESLEKASNAFTSAWDAVRDVLQQVKPVLEAVQRLASDVADLIGAVRAFVRRVFERHDDALKPGTTFRDVDAPWCPEMVVIPPGQFMMGSPDDDPEADDNEKPQHLVAIDYGLAVGRYPVTLDEYDRFAEVTGRDPPRDEGWGRGRRPVINVSWDDAKAYAGWLSKETGEIYRLLSEAEWEYVCRAGATTRYACGDEIPPESANYACHVGDTTTEVGSYPPNFWNLYDMHGNIWEWVEDCWNDSYEGAPEDGSVWTSGDCSRRVQRGGSWRNYPRNLRSACRTRNNSDFRLNLIGFRVSRALSTAWRLGRSPSRFCGGGRPLTQRRQPTGARQSGPALEAMYRFLPWLVPTVEKFPRSNWAVHGGMPLKPAASLCFLPRRCINRTRNVRSCPSTGLNVEKVSPLQQVICTDRRHEMAFVDHASMCNEQEPRYLGALRAPGYAQLYQGQLSRSPKGLYDRFRVSWKRLRVGQTFRLHPGSLISTRHMGA